MKLIRVAYGKKDTPAELREYQVDGVGPVGTLKEFKEHFPNEEFEVVERHPQTGSVTTDEASELLFNATKKKEE